MKHRVLTTLVLALCPAVAPAQVGRPLPAAEIEDLQLTAAESFDDFVGRAVLIEFFAYW